MEIGPCSEIGTGAAGARLLADQTEVADEHRLGRVRQVVDLRHAVGAPLRVARHQVGDAGVALPEVLVRALEALDDGRQQRRLGRVGHVPDFVRLVAEHAQHVELALVALGQVGAAQTRTICAPPCSALPSSPGNVRQVSGLASGRSRR